MARRRLAYPAFRQPPQVTFGTGSVRAVAQSDQLTAAVLLMSGDVAVQQTVARAFESGAASLPSDRVLTKPAGEPTAESIADAAKWLADRQFDTLIVVGGGSVLDWARLALAAARGWLVPESGRITEGLRSSDRPHLILVPTSCGSGAEAAAVAVYALNGNKVAVVSDAFLADRVILDAQFLAHAAPSMVASWVCDTMSHGVEAFLSIVPNTLAKQAAISALQIVFRNYGSPELHCRAERLMEAGYLGGVAASNCSVGVIHAFAHTMAAYGVPHALANAFGLQAGIAANATTSEMRNLLDHLGLPSVEALSARVGPIVDAAVSAPASDRVRAALADESDREAIVARMTTDVCLRTNPRRMERAELLEFLDAVGGVFTHV